MNDNERARGERRRPSRHGRKRSGVADKGERGQVRENGVSDNPRPAADVPAAPKFAPRQAREKKGGEAGRRAGGRNNARKNQQQEQPRSTQTQKSRNEGSNGSGTPDFVDRMTSGATRDIPQRPRLGSQKFVPAPRIVAPELPKPLCPRCGLPIEDLPSALTDKESGNPVHFDCIVARIAEGETLMDGDKVVYLGGGRFGVVHFENNQDPKNFQVRKTIQWEEKDKRAPWRRDVSDLYSST